MICVVCGCVMVNVKPLQTTCELCEPLKELTMDTPTFLKDQDEGITQDTLQELKDLVELYKAQSADVEELEEDAKEAKKRFNKTSQELIPNLLLAHGLTDIRIDTGEKITVKEDVSVTVKDDDKFFAFLKKRDEDDIIKLQVSFARMDSEKISALFAFLLDNEYDYEMQRNVHGQTKKKYFKELLGLGKSDIEEGLKSKKYMRREALEIFAKLFVFHTTKIK